MNNVDKKTKASTKPPVHEIINLDDSTAIVPALQQQLFVADLASQCGSLLNWASDTNGEVLAQLLWKNKMRIKALQRYQQLDNDQIRKLVDRDWRVMSQTNKKDIVSNHKKVNYNDLQSRFDSLKEKLNNQKRIKNGQ